MATMTVARSRTPDTLQHRLLQLDCSSDLRSYSRNLGPGVQEKTFQRTSDALRAQLEEHRDYLLRHQQHGQAQLTPVSQFHSPVAPSQQVMPPSHHATPVFRDVGRPQYHVQPPQPQAPQALAPQWSRAPKPPSPIPGKVETYPRALRDALEQCRRQTAATPDDGTLYHVIYELAADYMDDQHEVVTTCRTPWIASNKVAEYFVGEFLNGCAVDDPEYEVSSQGTLRCEVATDGSLGGRAMVFVRPGRMHG
ncbi:hypothetical protein NX059_007262 [Plenodomus lindquistii]|nr:hypothetical protein NX059_007262 [Plenodomus lindquistii]